MGRISKTSSFQKKKIHSDYIGRNRKITETGMIERVKPISPSENSTKYSSSNYLIASDVFYDKLEQLREEYRKFYHHERDLEIAIESINNSKDKLSEHMMDLIFKYNRAISSLEDFDKICGTAHCLGIKEILLSFEGELNKVGINIINEKELDIDLDIFIERVINSRNPMSDLFKPVRAMIIKLYKGFKHIKIPKKNSFENQYKEYDDLSSQDYNGIIIDEKS